MKREEMMASRILYPFDGWELSPEGAAIHQGERTAVIADLHLGYEWARGAAGDCVVAHSLNETIAGLSALLSRARVDRVIVAGDLVESPLPCRRTRNDVRALRQWLAARSVELVVLEGNHDRGIRHAAEATAWSETRLAESCNVASWTIGHGHRPIRGRRVISGHHHPALKVGGISAPCFLVGQGRIVLPAFSTNAAGCDVATAAMPPDWRPKQWRCIASTGVDLLDFGTLSELRRKLRLPRARVRTNS